jgi:metal-sulfur cluster biosynthetic enzyme
MSVSRERVIEALRAVFDPELGMSVVDLGLIYDIGIDSRRVASR